MAPTVKASFITSLQKNANMSYNDYLGARAVKLIQPLLCSQATQMTYDGYRWPGYCSVGSHHGGAISWTCNTITCSQPNSLYLLV